SKKSGVATTNIRRASSATSSQAARATASRRPRSRVAAVAGTDWLSADAVAVNGRLIRYLSEQRWYAPAATVSSDRSLLVAPGLLYTASGCGAGRRLRLAHLPHQRDAGPHLPDNVYRRSWIRKTRNHQRREQQNGRQPTQPT